MGLPIKAQKEVTMYFILYDEEMGTFDIWLEDGIPFGDELIYSFDTLEEAEAQLAEINI